MSIFFETAERYLIAIKMYCLGHQLLTTALVLKIISDGVLKNVSAKAVLFHRLLHVDW